MTLIVTTLIRLGLKRSADEYFLSIPFFPCKRDRPCSVRKQTNISAEAQLTSDLGTIASEYCVT